MTDYIETYELLGGRYSIEDLDSPGNHFMPESAKGRFQCWWNGCGIGHADTVEDARELVQNVLTNHIMRKLADIERTMSDIRFALPRLMNLQDSGEEVADRDLRQIRRKLGLSLDELISSTCREYGVSKTQLLRGRRTAEVFEVRCTLATLLCRNTSLSVEKIGHLLGLAEKGSRLNKGAFRFDGGE